MRAAGLGMVGAAVGLWATRLTAGFAVQPPPRGRQLGLGRGRPPAALGGAAPAVGLWPTAPTAESNAKPRAWYAELGVGGALLLTGAVWAGVGTSRWNQNQISSMRCANSEGLDCFASHRMAAGFFLGAGTAMVLGSTIGLLVQRKYMKSRPRAALSPYFAGGGAGLMVQGRF